MFHSKFQEHETSGYEEDTYLKDFKTVFEYGGHLGHVTWTNGINLCSPTQRYRLHRKVGFD